jgi:putative DNA primase/helicase
MIADLRITARALCGEVAEDQIICPGPGHGPRDRSLSVRPSASGLDGFLVHSFAGDDWRDCADHVRRLLGIECDRDRKLARRQAAEALRRAPEPQRQDDDGRDRALVLWRSSLHPRGTLAESYLKSRGLAIGADIAGRVLRWHPGISGIVALFRSIETDEPQAISRTFLDREGRKLGRKFLGPVRRAAVKLDPDEEVLDGLHIGEGVETCLAARQLGLRPTWALGSKGAVGGFPILAGIGSLTILAEPDAEKEIEAVAMRWHAAGREVLINRPLEGKDLNDALKGSAA